ncbi:Serine/threonine-protein kinase/endoribonuclease IRE1 [Holothuria leucospilota]|uniref:Serine/threonine-protein kinase/endoribonuclease IRE1 n=1 Tax=Holothuria leucospilota TaxID=206669 RepID=A0A9Q1BWY1_HOLLE|nr:Serine/threonine-protein kinase/endoribonuclease IRE1 [Holothuria leucospilota]
MISRISSGVDTLKSVGSIKYSNKEKIGTGSSGSRIFGGRFGNKTVAVKKIISENIQREPELYNLMKTKSMCNVLKILHVEEDEEFSYIVTELCEYDLKAVIEDNKNPIGAILSPEKRVKLCVDILKGLRDLHSIDVIHCDLKPSNILIGVDGEAYVADFGISRNLIGKTTHATGFYGTLCWMAREGMQSENNKVRYKKESDVQAEVFTYSHFKEKLASTLQTDECTKLAHFFKISKDQKDAILSSNKPSKNLLHALEEKGILQPYNVERLTDAFVDLEMCTFCLHLAEIYQKTRGSRFVSEDISDLTSFKVIESKLGMGSDGQEMTDETDENCHSQRWASMISRISSGVDTLKSVGSIKYSRKEKIGTGSLGSHIFGGKFGNKTVAVKKIVSENVQRESELYNLMKKKAMNNVLKILHVEEDEDFTYIVTELCEYDLKAVIEDNKNPIGASLSPEKRVKLCVDILKGLRDLHSIDVIHRDLKPSNILIGVDGEAYVADFGISRNLIGETTHATGFYGTLCWMARESMQFKNNKVRYKKESDVQVAGCLMYYVLSNGHHPFEATFPFISDTGKLMNNVAEGTYSLFHIETYPAQCTALLKRMLDKDMLKRPRIDDCLKETEAVRYASITMKSIMTSGEQASAATVLVPNIAYLSESAIPDEFSRLIAKISQNITRSHCVLLATYFNFSQAKIAVIKVESQTPGLDLLEIMKERNKINMYDLTNLQQALVELQLNEINETLVIPYQSKIDPRTHERHKILQKSP